MKTDLHEKKIEKKNEFLKKLNEKSIESTDFNIIKKLLAFHRCRKHHNSLFEKKNIFHHLMKLFSDFSFELWNSEPASTLLQLTVFLTTGLTDRNKLRSMQGNTNWICFYNQRTLTCSWLLSTSSYDKHWSINEWFTIFSINNSNIWINFTLAFHLPAEKYMGMGGGGLYWRIGKLPNKSWTVEDTSTNSSG